MDVAALVAALSGQAGPGISVIVPTKNERQNLPRLLATLPPDVELIVCDASDDGTPELALALRPERTCVIQAPGTIAEARQQGAQASTGEILVFSDADVAFSPDYFERLTHLFGRANTAGQAVTDGVCGPKLSQGAHAGYYRLVAGAQRATFGLLKVAGASGSNMAITRAAFDHLGGFRLALRCNEDTELFLRAGRRGLRVTYDDDLVVWATDHRRLQRGVARKSVHSLARNVLLYLLCTRPRLPRLLVHDWGYWGRPSSLSARTDSLEAPL